MQTFSALCGNEFADFDEVLQTFSALFGDEFADFDKVLPANVFRIVWQ